MNFVRVQNTKTHRFALIASKEILLVDQTGDLAAPVSVLFGSGVGATMAASFEELCGGLSLVPGFVRVTSGRSGLSSYLQAERVVVVEQTGDLEKPTKIMFDGGIALTTRFTLDELLASLVLLNPDQHDEQGIRQERTASLLLH